MMGIRETIDVAARADAAARRERLAPPEMIQRGRAVRHGAIVSPAAFYAVIGAGAGDGVYKCYPVELDADRWTDVGGATGFVPDSSFGRWSSETTYDANDKNIYHEGALYNSIQAGNLNHEPPSSEWWTPVTLTEALNLLEQDVEASYYRGLAVFDCLSVSTIRDDADSVRRVGVPLAGGSRLVRAKEDAPGSAMGRPTDSGTSIACNVELIDKSEAQDGDVGYGIEVYGLYAGDTSAPNWNAVIPEVKNGVWLPASYVAGVWYFSALFAPKCIGTASCV